MGFLCLSATITTLIPKFDKAKFRPIRAALFFGAALSIIGVLVAIRAFPNQFKTTTSLTGYIIGCYFYL